MTDLLLAAAAAGVRHNGTVLGIDPGAGGALALLDAKAEIIAIEDMPVIEVNGKRRVSSAAVAEIIRTWKPSIAIVERVISISKQSAAGALNFGYSAGILEGAIAMADISLVLAYPITWKRAMGVSGDKGGCRIAAQRMWPARHKLFSRVRDDGRAESALIAAYQVMQWSARS